MAEPPRLRAYAGVADLHRMQAALSERFGAGVDHPGDLAWAVRDSGHVELGARVTLVESAASELLGWTWFHLNGWFDAVAVAPHAGLAPVLVQAALDTAARCAAAGDDVERLTALCGDDDPDLAAALRAQGFAEIEGTLEITRRGLADLPPPLPPPPGYRLSGTEDEALVERRVECHRAAFSPSSLTLAGLRRVRRTWPYRPGLDRVVVADDGEVVAACQGWLDPRTGWGLLEPVGTRPTHQRRGLATLVCLDALHALREAGAHSAQVVCESGSAGCATYHGLGFATATRMRMLRRAAASAGS